VGEVVAVDLSDVTVEFKAVNTADFAELIVPTSEGVSIVDAKAGLVSYDFSSAAVDTAGRFRGFFIVTSENETDHYPAKVDDMLILIDNDLQSAERAYAAALV
jgi:hypothetical protein